MSENRKIIGEKCYLTKIKISDAENWAIWYNDIDISMPESNVYDVITTKNTRGTIEWYQSNNSSVFTIVDNKSEKRIGLIELEIDLESKTGSFGIVIGEKDYWGLGYGKEATQLILDYAFNSLNINNMMLGVYALNQRAYCLYKHIGFKEIGRKREYQAIGGQRFDMIMMDMLASEFKGVGDVLL